MAPSFHQPKKEGPSAVRVEPITGPGICGADFPLKVAAIGEGTADAQVLSDTLPGWHYSVHLRRNNQMAANV